MLKEVDVLVYDIQDVGVRFYTFISTLGECMAAAAEKGIQRRAHPLHRKEFR